MAQIRRIAGLAKVTTSSRWGSLRDTVVGTMDDRSMEDS
jgi:hypothetical protein